MHRCTRTKSGANLLRVLVLTLASFALPAGAASVYQCRDAAGDVTYQDHACAAKQQESRIELAAIPAATTSPDYGRRANEHATKRERAASTGSHRVARESEALSYECRGDSGSVFYRHSACPKSIRKKSVAGSGKGRHGRKSESSKSETESVTGIAMPRSEVCRRLAEGGSIGRGGHERDDQVSTYERNLGRDPCRRS
jgi:hypothetical protein